MATSISVFVDPACPWAWSISRWLRNEVGERAVGRFYTGLGYRLSDPERPGSTPMAGIIRASLKAADLHEAAETAASDPIWQRHVVRSTRMKREG
jgi:hypothetical protein